MAGSRDVFYHNNGDGTFADITEKAGIDAGEYFGLGVVMGDYDRDSRLDIYVANDSTPSSLYHNNGDGTFTDVGPQAGVAYSGEGQEQAGMGIDFGDIDNDGWPDLVKGNFSDDTKNLYHNNRDGTFTDLTYQAGIGDQPEFNIKIGLIPRLPRRGFVRLGVSETLEMTISFSPVSTLQYFKGLALFQKFISSPIFQIRNK